MKKILILAGVLVLMTSSMVSALSPKYGNKMLPKSIPFEQGITLKNAGSGKITTSIKSTSYANVGTFRSQCFWSADTNQNIQTYGAEYMQTLPMHSYIDDWSETYARFLYNSGHARVQLNGLFNDYGIYLVELMHIYDLHGNGTYQFASDELMH